MISGCSLRCIVDPNKPGLVLSGEGHRWTIHYLGPSTRWLTALALYASDSQWIVMSDNAGINGCLLQENWKQWRSTWLLLMALPNTGIVCEGVKR